MLRQFYVTLRDKAMNGNGPRSLKDAVFTGRKVMYAKKLSSSAFDALAQYPDVTVNLEKFLREMLKRYSVPSGTGNSAKLLRARARLLSDGGKWP